ncbi:MAG: hypothetical protein K1X65_05865 [Caldilineales bacterium]|nr:hypothetical protein [Caldilineales bacterium]MCW5858084.1 hypothetical protein [Caldilineales bacterium]
MKSDRPFTLTDAARYGLYGGIAAILIALVGMVQAFAKTGIIANLITMAQVLVYGLAFVVAIIVAGRAARSRRSLAVPAAVIAGAVSMLLLALLALLIDRVNLREIFTNAGKELANLLLPGEEIGLTSALILTAIGAAVGLVAGLFTFIPAKLRSALIGGAGAVILVGLMQDVLIPVLPESVDKFLYVSKGLKPLGALAIFVLFFVLVYLNAMRRRTGTSRLDRLPPQQRQVARFALTLVALIILTLLPRVLGPFLSEVADQVGFYIIMALGLNVVVGFAGMLDLGYVAFYAIGAYTMAVLTTPELPVVREFLPQLTFWEALPFAVGAALLAGIFLGIPVLKTRGDYLAIITLGFGEIIRLLVLSDALKPLLGGAQGITGVGRPKIADFTATNPQQFYYFILVAIVIAWFITSRLKASRLGRSWMAIREDEDVAAAMSINLVGYKLLAFATGATLAGLSGALFGSKLGSMVPASFNVLVSINVLAVLIVGGMGSLPGAIVGAIVLIGLPELLREFNEFRWWVYGAVLVFMMLNKPEGLWPEATRVRELHEAAAEEHTHVVDDSGPTATTAA